MEIASRVFVRVVFVCRLLFLSSCQAAAPVTWLDLRFPQRGGLVAAHVSSAGIRLALMPPG